MVNGMQCPKRTIMTIYEARRLLALCNAERRKENKTLGDKNGCGLISLPIRQDTVDKGIVWIGGM